MLYQIENRKNAFSAQEIYGLSPTPHIHPHIELICLREGSAVCTVDNKEFVIEAGDMILIFPNQIHFYHECTPTVGYMSIFSPDLFRELKDLFYKNIPTYPVVKSESLSFGMPDKLKHIVNLEQGNSPFEKISANGYLLAFLGETLSHMTFVPTPSDQDSIKKLLHYCSANYTEPLTLDMVSKQLHLSKYHISHIFKERMGIGFTDFLNSLRTEHACELLEKGTSITEVAFSSGFSSIRTFNRVFVQNMGMTPREYIRLKESDN